ncbi:hypothetical protein DL95DRAFT_387451 [Leptodontidium sp. 2 PMI_412]|nr:hypothetical protein DL95DRAFT_387451 [Leptodontidium sp. 2 PMI_412]
MSFVIHNRAEEDDSSTTKLLSPLWQAGANINSRNSQEETALHLAVKLGRRAATKFLLSHGANIHVRNYKGLGVLALGYYAIRPDIALYLSRGKRWSRLYSDSFRRVGNSGIEKPGRVCTAEWRVSRWLIVQMQPFMGTWYEKSRIVSIKTF